MISSPKGGSGAGGLQQQPPPQTIRNLRSATCGNNDGGDPVRAHRLLREAVCTACDQNDSSDSLQ